MANVKFYRLGLNGGVSNASYLEYTNTTDGRIVFAQVKGENAGDPLEHYIWANGVEYHVADASALHKIEHTLNILLDGASIDTSIGKMIQDALDGYELTAENFVNLVDSSNSNVKVSILDSSIVLTAPVSHANITVGTVSPEESGLAPSHGDYYVKEEVITEKLGVEPRRTAYIYNADDEIWQALDGNVDATNVFFKNGVNRTAAIGVLPATANGEIENEGKAMNLKELLEYYLVEEMYPTVLASTGIANVSKYAITLDKPNDLTTYMDHTDKLVEVGTKYTFASKGFSIKESATHDGKSTYTSNKSTITGMNFGAATTVGGEVDTNKTTAEAGPITTTASYNDNFDEATATVTLTNNRGFTGISTSTNTVIVNGQTLTLPTATGIVVEGENKLTLSWSSDASVTRDITKDKTIPAMEYYYASNKGNTSTNKIAKTSTVSWVDNNPTVTVSDKTTTFSVNAVYPYYSNGIEQTVAETVGSFTTQSITIKEGGVTKTVNAKKLALYNYKSAVAKTTYVGFGLAGVEAGEQPKIFYIPNSANVTSLVGNAYNSNKEAGKASSFDAGCGTWTKDGTVFINDVAYTKWINTGKFGAQNIQIKFA